MSRKNRKSRRSRNSRSFRDSADSRNPLEVRESHGPNIDVSNLFVGLTTVRDGNAVFSSAPYVFQTLHTLPVADRVQRIEDFVEELGEYKCCTSVLDLEDTDLRHLKMILRDETSTESERTLGLDNGFGGRIMLALPEMVRLYRFMCAQSSTPTIERISYSVLTSLARNIAAARYFKAFDEQAAN